MQTHFERTGKLSTSCAHCAYLTVLTRHTRIDVDISSHAAFLYRAFNSADPRAVNFSYAVPRCHIFRKMSLPYFRRLFAFASMPRTHCEFIRGEWIHTQKTSASVPQHLANAALLDIAAIIIRPRIPRVIKSANIRASASAEILAAPHRHTRRTSTSSHPALPCPAFSQSCPMPARYFRFPPAVNKCC